MRESITVTVEGALQELRSTYAEAVSALESERVTLENESQAILKAADHLRLLLPAKAREAQRAADVLLLAGKGDEAQAKIAEQQEAERAPAEMEQRRLAIAARVEKINGEEKAIARKVFQEWFPGLRAALVEEQRIMCEALNTAWTGIETFALDTGAQVIPATLRCDLTAREHGPEKTTFLGLLDWFGGRQ